MAESKAAAAKAEAAPAAPLADTVSTVDEPAVETTDGRPTEDAEAHRKAWAEANHVDPSEMREIHYPGGWVDRFDGRGWVREEGA